jgi:hypothetical protein
MLNLYQPNADQNDTTYWQRANPSFYLSAQTYDPSVTTSGPSLLNLGTGQSVYLFAYSNQRNINNTGLTWLVNSSDAQIATGSSGWTSGNYQVAEGDFMATQPGIYTVQADENGTYSMPLVLVVGMSQLSSQSAVVTPDQMGIQSLPSTLPVITPTTQAGVTYAQYSAQGNWIPISGSTTLGVSNMNVILDGASGQEWSYRLPVVNGTFSGMVEAPFSGQVTVTLFPHYFQTMTQLADTNATSYYYPASSYTVNVSGVSLSAQAQAVLASAHRDYNLSPQFATVASTLLENSPSMETAMAAISNDASESIMYNQKELQTVNYIWQDVLTAWNAHSGVCEDFSSLAAAMMQSVGIPTQTVGGWANQYWTTPPATDTNPADAHQWDQAWDGSGWLVFDPTWNTDDTSSTSDYVTNEFFTNTTSFAAVHLADPTQTGLDLSRKT